jgi:oligopeptide transport system substrate-binding protein
VGAAGLIVALALVAGWRVGTELPDEGTAAQEEQPEQGGVLRMAVERPGHLDPALTRTMPVSESVVADLLFDGLTTPGEDPGTVEPALADSWEASEDQRSWTFFLRPGARFANGDEVTAGDVVATLTRIARKDSRSPVSTLLAPVQGYRPLAVDGSTQELTGVTAPETDVVRIDLDEPVATLPDLLSAPAFGIVPKATGPVGEDRMFDQAPTGSGPFALAEGEKLSGGDDEGARLVRAQGGRTLLAGIELQFHDEVAGAAESFAEGEADWSVVPDNAIDDPVGPSRLDRVPLPATLFYGIDLTSPKLADPRLREAIVRAVDRDAIAEEVYGRALEPTTGVVPEAAGGDAEADPCDGKCDFDPERAKALVKEAFPTGLVPEVAIDLDDGEVQRKVADAIVADLREVGIPAAAKPHPLPEFRTFASAVPGQEMLRFGWVGTYATPDSVLRPLFSTGSPDNVVGVSDPAIDGALDRAAAEADPEARAELYAEAERAAMGHLAVLPLGQFVTHVAVADQVRDLATRPGATFDATRVWLAADER